MLKPNPMDKTMLNKKINKNNSLQLDVASLPKGIFLVKATNIVGVVKTNKLIINRS